MSLKGAISGVWRRWLVRAAGSALLLGILFWALPRDAILAGFSRVPLSLFLTVLVLFLLGHAVAAAKWWVLLERSFPFPLALKAHFGGLAANLCLPGAAGGDAVRAGLVHATMRDAPKLTAGAVADRLIDMLGLACLSLTGILMLQDGAGASIAIQSAVLVLVILAGVVFVMPWAVERLWSRIPALPARDFALKTAGAFRILGRRPGLLLSMLVLSMAVQALFIYLALQLALVVGVDVPFGAWLFAWPLAKILAVLPISLGGLGVREATLAALLTPFGGVAADVVAAGLVWQAVLWVTGGLGALVLTLSGLKLRPAAPPIKETPNERC